MDLVSLDIIAVLVLMRIFKEKILVSHKLSLQEPIKLSAKVNYLSNSYIQKLTVMHSSIVT